MPYTYVLLPVSEATYNEIKTAFEAAEYHHAFHSGEAKGIVIDMHGVALVQDDGKMFNIVKYAAEKKDV